MTPQKGHPQVSQGEKPAVSPPGVTFLKTVSITHKELAGEEAGEGPSESAEAQNSAEKCVRSFHPTPHTPQEDRGLFMAISEKAGATAKSGLAGVVLEREKHGKRK